MARIPSPTRPAPARVRHARGALLGALLALAAAWSGVARGADDGPRAARDVTESADLANELLGHPARAWTFTRWLDGRPLTLEGLRGKVVLVRWFTNGCRFCGNSLPGLEALRKRYAPQGLVVVGVYHPKPPRAVSDGDVRRMSRKLGFHGPVAVDEDWRTLNRWWLANHPERNWTSVSFLVDREGVVRWAHGGGEYHASADPRHAACDARHAELERTIQRLLGEPAAAR